MINLSTKLFSLLFVFAWTSSAFPQKEVDNGIRFKESTDSIRYLKNISTYTEYLKTDHFQEAYIPWKAVFTEAPTIQVETYTNGVKILRVMIADAKTATEQKNYFNELMNVYDQHILYLDQLNKLVKNPTTKGAILGMKAHDYLMFSGKNLDLNKAYQMGKEAINLEKSKSSYFMFQDMIDIASQILGKTPDYKEQFIQDYLTVSQYVNEAYRTETDKQIQKLLATVKDNIDAYFINSGIATCESLQTIYGPKIEQNKSNLNYLKKVISIMQTLKCTDQNTYFQACEAAYAIEPTASIAISCGCMYYKKDSLDKSINYFNKAIELTEGNDAKAKIAYNVGTILFNKKQLSQAKQYCLKALSFNKQYGKAYLLIAQMYASNPNWSQDPVMNRCTYFAVIDKLMEAKTADPDLTQEVDQLIASYTAHTPKDEDLFFNGLKKGESINIGGWIHETTTVR